MCAHIVQRRSILCCVVVLELSSFILIFLVANSCCLFCSQPASLPGRNGHRSNIVNESTCASDHCFFGNSKFAMRIDSFGLMARIALGLYFVRRPSCVVCSSSSSSYAWRRRWLLNCDQIGPIFRCFASGIVLPKFRLFWGWFAVFALNRSDGRWVGRSVSW